MIVSTNMPYWMSFPRMRQVRGVSGTASIGITVVLFMAYISPSIAMGWLALDIAEKDGADAEILRPAPQGIS
jgi:hypothetical protein